MATSRSKKTTKASEQTKEVVAQEAQDDNTSLAIATSRPDFMKRGSRRGIETMGSEDFELATVGILQALSPQVEKEGLRAGFLYHNILEAILQDDEGDNAVSVVPIMNRIRYVIWQPRHVDNGGQLACASDGIHWDVPNQVFEVQTDEDDPYKETWRIGEKVTDLTMCPDGDGKFTKSVADFGTYDIRKTAATGKESSPAATKSYNFLCVASNRLDLGPFIVFLQRTSEKVGKKWNQKIRAAGTDSFGQVFKLGGEYKEEGAKKKYWKYTISNAGFVQDEAEYKAFEAIYEEYSSMEKWNIKEDTVAPSDGGTVIEGQSEEVNDEM